MVDISLTVYMFIRCLCAAPLLPSHLMWTGVLEIWAMVEASGWETEMAPLFQYFHDEWLPRRDELSVFGFPDRTNNCSETDNRMMANALPQNHPNVYNMIGE